MNTIYLVRHGETDWNIQGKYQGFTDVPLNERGLAQAKACAEAMKEFQIDRIISSDLSRAQVTAESINAYHHAPLKVDSRIREVNFGDWETLHIDEIDARWPGMIWNMYRHPETTALPNGETFQEVQDRAWEALSDEIADAEDGQSILVVCHGGTIRTLLCKLIHLPLHYTWNFSQGNTAINCIAYYGMGDNDHNTISFLNDTKHTIGL